MPYEWVKSDEDARILHLWPYRSLSRNGMVWFVGSTSALIALPLLVLLGSPVLWGLLPFLMAAVAAIFFALNRSYRDGEILEVLELSPDQTRLTRHGPGQKHAEWQANSHWIKVNLTAVGGPVAQYLTMQGNGREVELGAFLTPEERKALDIELRKLLRSI